MRAVLVADGDRLTTEHVTIAATPTTPATASPSPASARASASTSGALAAELDAMERQRILDALAACNGNQTRAAEMLGMP